MIRGIPHSSRDLIRRAEDLGWRVERTAKCHLKFKHDCGAVVIGAATPSDHRSTKNLEAMLRRKLKEMMK